MSISTIQIVIDAQDRASRSIETVRGKLLNLTRTTKTIKRTGSGLGRFAGALDILAGTDLNPIIGQLTTVALVAEPLADAADGIATKVQPAFQAMGSKLGESTATGIGLGIGSVAAGAAIAVAFDQLALQAQHQAEALTDEQSRQIGDSFGGQIFRSLNQALIAGGMQGALGPGFQGLLDQLTGFGGAVADSDVGHAAGVGWAQSIFDSFHAQMEQKRADFAASALSIDGDLASALQNNTSVIDAAMDKVTWAIEHPMELVAQKANLAGAITTLEYKRGLASNSDEVNTVIDQQLAALKGQWVTLAGEAWGIGHRTVVNYSQGLSSVNIPNVGAGFRDPYRDPGHRGPGGMASGGSVSAGGTYLIGEKGPELLHMGGRGGNITPNKGLGGGPIVVNIDGHELFRIMDERMGKRLALSSNNAYTRS